MINFFNSRGRQLKTICFSILLIVFLTVYASASDVFQIPKKLISAHDAALLASPNGQILFSAHADKKLIPASTLKILTSLVAIHYLGDTYRFPTDFFLDKNSNLIIKGYGDPLLVSEEIAKIAATIRGKTPIIHDIVLDDGFFNKPLTIPGTVNGSLQPYDAPNGALCVNFNTVNFRINHQIIVSAEPQTPVVDIARQKIKASELTAGRILLTNDEDEITRYAGQIFQYFLRAEGIKIRGEVRLGKLDPDDAELIYRHMSPYTLTDIISRLLEYSNNFIANQLLLAAGAKEFGPPATLEKGVTAAKNYLARQFDVDHPNSFKNLSLVEGSGISRNNRFSAEYFLEILAAFRPYHELMKQNGDEYYKTGTLEGVSTRVGYIVSKPDELYPFIVFMNTPGKTTGQLMKAFKQMVRENSAINSGGL